MASSLNDYKLDNQTFNLVGKTKKGIFPVQTKFKVNSTRDSYASEDPELPNRSLSKYESSIA